MANEKHLNMLQKGVTVWNQWRLDNPNVKPNLNWVIKPIFKFDTVDILVDQLSSKIIKPAEKMHKKRQKLLRELFPS